MKNYALIEGNSFEKIRKDVLGNEGKRIVFTSLDDDLKRKVLEKLDIDCLLIKQEGRGDFQKQRNSGFNQVLAKIAKKKNVIIGIDLEEVINSQGKSKAEILARIRQNIKLCNKNKLKMKFVGKSERNIYDLKALGLVLGMPSWMVSKLNIF